MFLKLKTEVLTNEEKSQLNFVDKSGYAVRFTNKKGDVMYVTVADCREKRYDEGGNEGESDRVIRFRLYDDKCNCLDSTSVRSRDYESERGKMSRDGHYRTIKPRRLIPASEAFSRARGEFSFFVERENLYNRAANVVAKIAKKREEAFLKYEASFKKAKSDGNPAVNAVRNFFGR